MLAVIASLLSSGAVTVLPASSACPSEQTITAELDHLGVLTALAEIGSPEVAVEGARMRVVFRGRDGAVLGVREIAAPTTCHERASTAAVFIAAWVGDWSMPLAKLPSPENLAVTPATMDQAPASAGVARPVDASVPTAERSKTETVPPLAPSLASPPADGVPPAQLFPPPSTPPSQSPPPTAKPVTPAGLTRRPRVEVAGWAVATNNGDATAIGAGLFAGYRFAGRVAAAALVETTGEREIAVGPAMAAYRISRLGLGACVLRTWGPLFFDAGIFPELTMLTARGTKQLNVNYPVTTWGAAMDLRVRLGLSAGRIAPFLFMGGSGALPAQKLTIEGATQTTTLSRWSYSAGIGLAFLFGAYE